MIYEFNGYRPVVHDSSYVHPQAVVTGNVIIGKDCYIGPGAAIRGDWGAIIIEDGCNVQENCTIHMFPGVTVTLQASAHIGHGAIIHGATIGKNCLVGMNAVIMDNVVLGDECIVGALSFIKADEKFSARSLIAGNPAKKIKDVSDEMIHWKTEGTKLYQSLPALLRNSLRECEPLREPEPGRPKQPHEYKTWKEMKKGKADSQ
ncbi:MAG: transferase hexapeptide repeat family protein [Chitinophagaceae bacterium]|nr:transferase hexapeptide repeat family protein [Chitinophagaceae bacterium]